MSWREPRWARPPPHQSKWSLDEIKGGIVLETHTINQRCTTFGRATDAVSIPTAHESCSRVHARLAFDSSGIPWLRDLGSSNGTFINKKRIPAKACGKVEDGHGEGSRGVVVFPGDFFVFGASTRMFCLVGPEEFGRNALAEKRAKEKAAREQAKASESSLSGSGEDNGVSWGIDTVEYERDNSDALIGGQSLQPLEVIPPRYQKMYEKLMSKKLKLDNIRRESDRIQNKNATSELTEGQASQLERNRQKEESLSKEVEDIEQELRRSIAGEESQISDSRVTRKRDTECSWDDEDDDFYDRTRVKKRKDEVRYEHAETEETLSAKWKKLVSTLKQNRAAVERAKEKKDAFEAKLCSIGDNDESEKYFIQNEIVLCEESIQNSEADIGRTEMELCDVEKVLQLVNKTLLFDRDIEFIGSKTSSSKCKRTQEHTGDSHDMLPPLPPQGIKNVPLDLDHRPSLEMMPPPKQKEPVGQSQSSHASSIGMGKSEGAQPLRKMAPPAKRRPQGPTPPPKGTLAVMLSVSNSSVSSKRTDKCREGQRVASVGENVVSSLSAQFDPRKDEWMEPSGQDGSGVTKLNKKFAGRY